MKARSCRCERTTTAIISVSSVSPRGCARGRVIGLWKLGPDRLLQVLMLQQFGGQMESHVVLLDGINWRHAPFASAIGAPRGGGSTLSRTRWDDGRAPNDPGRAGADRDPRHRRALRRPKPQIEQERALLPCIPTVLSVFRGQAVGARSIAAGCAGYPKALLRAGDRGPGGMRLRACRPLDLGDGSAFRPTKQVNQQRLLGAQATGGVAPGGASDSGPSAFRAQWRGGRPERLTFLGGDS